MGNRIKSAMEFDVHESLQLQLSELEMLISMFPNEGDLCVTDPGVVSEIQDFLSGKFELSDVQKLEYTIHLNLNGSASWCVATTFVPICLAQHFRLQQQAK